MVHTSELSPSNSPPLSRLPLEAANILIVDDRSANMLAMEVVLEPLGQNLVRARSGAEAIKRIDERDYAVILLDVQMPGWDGFETAFRIREKSRAFNTPIIFLTAASSDEASLVRGYAEGAVDYIIKPFLPEVLRTKVRIFVELYKRMAECRIARSDLRRLNAELERKVRDLSALERRNSAESLQSLTSPTWSADADLLIKSLNRAGERWFGRTFKEAAGESMKVLLGPEAFKLHMPSFELVLAGQEVHFAALIPHSRGEEFPVQIVAMPQTDIQDVITGFAAVVLNTTRAVAEGDGFPAPDSGEAAPP